MSSVGGGIFPCWFVIPNWNLKEDTIRCVESILHMHASEQTSIAVVDNASADGSAEALEAAFGRRVLVLRNSRNLGFAAAVNQGIRVALRHGAASVFILNNDTLLPTDTLQVLSESATKHPSAGVLAPAVFYADQADRLWEFGSIRLRGLGLPRRLALPPDQDEVELDYVTGCAMLVRAEVFTRVGLFDEGFFMYYEDVDFCHRARREGVRIVGVPRARVLHKVSRSAAQASVHSAYWRSRGLVRYYRKHWQDFPRASALTFLALKVLVEFSRIGLRAGKRQAKAWMRGVLEGLNAPIEQR